MNSYSLTQSISQRLVLPKFPRISLRFFWGVSFVLLFPLLIFYIFQISQITKGSYLIKTYERKIENFSKDNSALEVNFAQITALENIERMARELNFEKIQVVKYIQVLDNSLAGIHDQNQQKLAD